MRIRMNADRSNIQLAPRGPFIECLDVLENMLETIARSWNEALGQPIKHERVVRIRRMAEGQDALIHPQPYRLPSRAVTAEKGLAQGNRANQLSTLNPQGRIATL